MTKLLIVGKGGQLSRALLKDAKAFGFEAIVLGIEEMDIRDAEAVQRKIKETAPEIVVNTAAYNLVLRAEEYPEEAFSVNFNGVFNLSSACRDSEIKFVTYSTDYVFDGEEGVPNGEHSRPGPLQVYGASKLAGERAALELHPAGSWVVRTSALFGGGREGSPDKGNFVLNILKEAEEKDSVEASSEQIASPTFADDLSIATFRLLKKGAAPGLYHLVNEGHVSFADFAAEIFKESGSMARVASVDRGGLRGAMRVPRFSALANTKAKALGVELPRWQDGLGRYLKSL